MYVNQVVSGCVCYADGFVNLSVSQSPDRHVSTVFGIPACFILYLYYYYVGCNRGDKLSIL